MTVKEAEFRLLYHRFCTVNLNKKTKKLTKEFPDADVATHVITYGCDRL